MSKKFTTKGCPAHYESGERDENGYTLLINAIESKDINKAIEIINSCTDINVQCIHGDYPIHHAARYSYVEILRLLLQKGANVNAKADFNDTPLYYAVDVEIAKVLIKAGADVNAKADFNDTPLHAARNAEVAKVLIEAGADPDIKNDFGISAREFLCQQGGYYNFPKEFQSLSICQQEQKDVSAAGEINLAEDGN